MEQRIENNSGDKSSNSLQNCSKNRAKIGRTMNFSGARVDLSLRERNQSGLTAIRRDSDGGHV